MMNEVFGGTTVDRIKLIKLIMKKRGCEEYMNKAKHV